ncbi:MAG: hypothetical protein IPJ06_17370 [Saprospiraceae bacterium]|nr:hypothetical protein [Saprospiraceae bacterium]
MGFIRYLIVFLLSFTCLIGFSQKSDYTWVLGYKPINPDPDSLLGINLVNYSIGIKKAGYLPGEGHMLLTNASISHPETGELLAYTDGCRIFNRQFEQMINGDSINFGKTWSQYCTNFFGVTYYPSINTALFLPRPGHPDEVYLIHAKDTITKQSTYWMDKIYASTISFKTFPNGFVKKKIN